MTESAPAMRHHLLAVPLESTSKAVALATPLSPLAPETEVGRLAAQRLRGREIAQTCGLSVRTDENHLTNAYRKLGVTGHDELADALGLTPQTRVQHQ